MFHDPQDKPGKFCPICGREHFNEEELCTRCKDKNNDLEVYYE